MGNKYFIMNKIILSILFLFSFVKLFSQEKHQYLTDTSFKTLDQVRQAFEADWKKAFNDPNSPRLKIGETNKYIDYKYQKKERRYIQYKRWEDFVAPRVYPSGNLSLIGKTYENFKLFRAVHPKPKKLKNARFGTTWTFVGPSGAADGGRNAGRMNFIRFDPNNSNTIYAGAPAGGLWKSTDAGANWSPISDHLTMIGCSDLAIDPNNSSNLFLLTGDNDGGDTRSAGVFKSTDGGVTWSETGLKWTADQGKFMSRILINPTNPLILMVFGADGVYRTTNGGTSWSLVQSGTGYIKDAELKPGDPNIVYAVSTSLYRSTNGGASFTKVTSGLPTSDISRISLDVTPANANYVYILMAKGDGDIKGVYRSTDSGLNFAQMSTTSLPNVLGYNETFGSGNQTGYDMAFSVCKANADYLLASGVRNWKSTDGGVSWTVATKDCQNSNLEMHWDIHYLEWLPGSTTTAFAANDGGVFKTVNGGTCWSAINQKNISVHNIYGFGVATDNPEIMISGHQDGATFVHTNGAYNLALGGDGFQAFVDRTNSKVMYGELYFGGFCRSTDGGVNWTWLADNPGLKDLDGAWNTPWCQDPTTANTLWAGYDQVLKSTNRGDTWSQVGTIAGSGKMVDVKVAPTNSNVVYAARYNQLFITQNGGGTWTNVTSGLPVNQTAITCIAIHQSNPLIAWVTLSGYSAGNKVYKTTNGGSSWTNLSTGLPNLPMNCINYVPGSTNNEIYVGSDVGVFYLNDNISTWVEYFDGLPNTPVTDIEIYKKGSEIRVSTRGRGIWKAPLYNPNSTCTTPAAPTVTASINYCQNATAVVLTATASSGNTLKWYGTNATGGTASSVAPTPNTSIVGTTVYYVSQSVSTCESPRASITVTVTAVPSAPTVTAIIGYCQNAASSVLTATGTNLKWYGTSPTGGIASAIAPTPSTSVVGSTIYYVSQTVSSCESPRASITVTINTSSTWYADADGDGVGDASSVQNSCTQPSGYVSTSGDECPNDANKTTPGSCGCGKTEQSCIDCNGVVNGTAIVDNCGRCSGGNTGLTACLGSVQAEDACVYDGTIDNNNAGFLGTGFVNTTNAIGSSLQFAINASQAGNYTLGFRYASTAARGANLGLDGAQVAVMTFATTGAFTTWASEEITLSLKQGNNMIKLSATTAGGLANIDLIYFYSAGLGKGECVVTDVNAKDLTHSFLVFPNPFDQEINIQGNGAFEYELYNISGDLILSGSGNDKISLANELPKGVYTIKIFMGDVSKTVKLEKR